MSLIGLGSKDLKGGLGLGAKSQYCISRPSYKLPKRILSQYWPAGPANDEKYLTRLGQSLRLCRSMSKLLTEYLKT
jgi:hypothetical protein